MILDDLPIKLSFFFDRGGGAIPRKKSVGRYVA